MKKNKYQLTPAVHPAQRNDTHKEHCPPNDWEQKNASLAYELEAPPKCEKSVDVQEALVVGDIHSWHVPRR